jgi:hypothetical protein
VTAGASNNLTENVTGRASSVKLGQKPGVSDILGRGRRDLRQALGAPVKIFEKPRRQFG